MYRLRSFRWSSGLYANRPRLARRLPSFQKGWEVGWLKHACESAGARRHREQGGAAAQTLLQAGHSVTALMRDPSAPRAQSLAEQGVTPGCVNPPAFDPGNVSNSARGS